MSLAADYRQASGLGGGASYNYERYAGLQQSRSASPGDQANDPMRDVERRRTSNAELAGANGGTGNMESAAGPYCSPLPQLPPVR